MEEIKITLADGDWIFFINRHDDGKTSLSIPDCGGMADMAPKNGRQHERMEQGPAGIKDIRQTWTTVWEIQSEEALERVRRLIASLSETAPPG